MFQLSDFECDFLASMASNKTRIYTSVEDVLRDVLDSDFEVDSGSEFGDLSSSEEEMIDAGCDPEVESAVVRYVQEIFTFVCVCFVMKLLSTRYLCICASYFRIFSVFRPGLRRNV